MDDLTKKDLLIAQYQTPTNLEARIELHRRFSTAVQRWPEWVFNQLDLPPSVHILELGCGPGGLWAENLDRLPASWSVVLVDLSPGMIDQAQANLLPRCEQFTFAVADAGAIPFADNRFDAVIANHMLYHVADLKETLSEIRRVLKSSGALYAATNGSAHMRELDDLTPDFIDHMPAGSAVLSFTLQNGAAQLRPYFPTIEMRPFDDGLLVTEAAPLVNYQLSMTGSETKITAEQKKAFEDHIGQIFFQQDGVIKITKETGLFIVA